MFVYGGLKIFVFSKTHRLALRPIDGHRLVTAHFHLVPRLGMIVVALLHPLFEGAALLGAYIPPTNIFVTVFDEAHVLLNFKVKS